MGQTIMEKQQIEKLYFAKRIVDFPSQKSCFLTCTDQRSSVNTVYENCLKKSHFPLQECMHIETILKILQFDFFFQIGAQIRLSNTV